MIHCWKFGGCKRTLLALVLITVFIFTSKYLLRDCSACKVFIKKLSIGGGSISPENSENRNNVSAHSAKADGFDNIVVYNDSLRSCRPLSEVQLLLFNRIFKVRSFSFIVWRYCLQVFNSTFPISESSFHAPVPL